MSTKVDYGAERANENIDQRETVFQKSFKQQLIINTDILFLLKDQ